MTEINLEFKLAPGTAWEIMADNQPVGTIIFKRDAYSQWYSIVVKEGIVQYAMSLETAKIMAQEEYDKPKIHQDDIDIDPVLPQIVSWKITHNGNTIGTAQRLGLRMSKNQKDIFLITKIDGTPLGQVDRLVDAKKLF